MCPMTKGAGLAEGRAPSSWLYRFGVKLFYLMQRGWRVQGQGPAKVSSKPGTPAGLSGETRIRLQPGITPS